MFGVRRDRSADPAAFDSAELQPLHGDPEELIRQEVRLHDLAYQHRKLRATVFMLSGAGSECPVIPADGARERRQAAGVDTVEKAMHRWEREHFGGLVRYQTGRTDKSRRQSQGTAYGLGRSDH